MLSLTASRVNVLTATSKVLKERVISFYKSASLPIASHNTIRGRAKALFDRHDYLVKQKADTERQPKDFERRCELFKQELNQVFNMVPQSGLTEEQQRIYAELQVFLIPCLLIICLSYQLCSVLILNDIIWPYYAFVDAK